MRCQEARVNHAVGGIPLYSLSIVADPVQCEPDKKFAVTRAHAEEVFAMQLDILYPLSCPGRPAPCPLASRARRLTVSE